MPTANDGMLILAVFAGGLAVAQAGRVQPEAARLAPRVDLAAFSAHQVPAITEAAMAAVRSEAAPDLWGLRDPSRTFAPRARVNFADKTAQEVEPQFVDGPYGQLVGLYDLGKVSLTDVGLEVETEMTALERELAKARARVAEFDPSSVENAGELRRLKEEIPRLKAKIATVEEKARAKASIEEREGKTMEVLEAELEKDLEVREKELVRVTEVNALRQELAEKRAKMLAESKSSSKSMSKLDGIKAFISKPDSEDVGTKQSPRSGALFEPEKALKERAGNFQQKSPDGRVLTTAVVGTSVEAQVDQAEKELARLQAEMAQSEFQLEAMRKQIADAKAQLPEKAKVPEKASVAQAAKDLEKGAAKDDTVQVNFDDKSVKAFEAELTQEVVKQKLNSVDQYVTEQRAAEKAAAQEEAAKGVAKQTAAGSELEKKKAKLETDKKALDSLKSELAERRAKLLDQSSAHGNDDGGKPGPLGFGSR